MDFAYGESFTESSPEAYRAPHPGLMLLGDANLFPRTEEVELSWKILDPIERYWDEHGAPAQYPAGTWGPVEAGPHARTRRTELAPPMKTDLTDTTASKINKALVLGRRAIGTPAIGMVLTLVIVTDEENAYDALKAASDAAHEHPSRTLVVIKRVSRSPRDRTKSRLDAEVRLGADAGTGETIVLRLYGDVVDHAQSVVLPLLLPDAPVVVWWPVNAPLDPAGGPAGRPGPAPGSPTPTPARSRYGSWPPAPTPTRRATPTCPGPASRRGARCSRRPWTRSTARCRRSRWRARSTTRAASCSRCGSRTAWTCR